MKLEEAAAILQISLPCPRREARAAYLRLVKVNKPDRDPEAFRRIREAWEALEHAGDPIGAWLAAPAASLTTEPDASAADAPSPPGPRVDPPAQPSADAPGPEVFSPLDPPAVPLAAADPLEPFRARMDRLGPEADPEALVVIAAEAVSAHPAEPGAHFLLYEELMSSGRAAEAADALRRARDAGLPGFFEELVASHVERLTVDELWEAARTATQPDPGPVARELGRRGFTEAALELAIPALGPDRSAWLAPYYDLFFELVRQSALGGATRLRDALDGARARSGKGRAQPTIAGLPCDAVVREVMEVAAGLPGELRRKIVDALLENLSAESLARVESFRARFPGDAALAHALLERKAPMLAALFAPSLRDAGARAKPLRRGETFRELGGSFGVIAAVIVATRVVVTLLAGSCDAGPPIRPLNDPAASAPILTTASSGGETVAEPSGADAGVVSPAPRGEP